MQLLNSRLKSGDFMRATWSATPNAGTSLEDILAHGYWASVARNLGVGDRIDVLPEDFTFFAQLLVRAKSHDGATVVLLQNTDLTGVEVNEGAADEYGGHRIAYSGPSLKWTVTRLANGKKPEQLLRDGFESREDARTYAKDQLAARNRAA